MLDPVAFQSCSHGGLLSSSAHALSRPSRAVWLGAAGPGGGSGR